ncbi:hypothetical protein CN307_15515 [Bacillus cereus]|uniref:Uncharacterized protein n=1 Tax=Bacillus cereus TaxID=1396 RepID=A0A2A8ZZ35_BACCE|nr:hypothetical protein CN307_15515 [Bacillus cereus]
MEAIFSIVTVFASIIPPLIAKKKNWKTFNISLNRGLLKIKIGE